MTPEERRNDKIINGSRRKRIANGSGTSVEQVNRLLKQFNEMRKVLQMMNAGGLQGMMKGMKAPPQMPQGKFAAPGGKKRKKGGPWGLIKAR
jgi:signal recognition particle subunit SRP54